MKNQKVIYEPHPVTPERKQELRDKGYKIIDAEFAPEGYEYPESEKPKEALAEKTEVDMKDPVKLKKLKVAELHEILNGLNIPFETDANKDALIALIVSA